MLHNIGVALVLTGFLMFGRVAYMCIGLTLGKSDPPPIGMSTAGALLVIIGSNLA
jgi:hypothetical protein